MPIWLRRYTFQEIEQFYLDQKEQQQDASGKPQLTVAKPDIRPNYTTKASK